MKALTLWQPWASLIALGVKTIETRSWPASKALIGQRIAIHAAKNEVEMKRICRGARRMHHRPSIQIENALDDRMKWTGFQYDDTWGLLPLGAVVATATLAECVQVLKVRDDGTWTIMRNQGVWSKVRGEITDQLPYGDFAPGRWAWMLTDVEVLPVPVPATGRQGIWTWEP